MDEVDDGQSIIRVRGLIHLFEKGAPKKHKTIDDTEESVDIVKHASKEVLIESISSTPVKVHHAAHETHTTKTILTSPHQTSYTKNDTEEKIVHVQVHKATYELTNRDTPTHTETPELNRIRELEEHLKMRQYENDRLRNDIHGMATKLELMEVATEQLKKDHEVQRRESAVQLNGMNKKLEETTKQLHNYHREKDELKTVKDELLKERLSSTNHERRLNEANAKIAELLRQMGEKEEQLMRMNNINITEKVEEELEKERLLKFELVKKLSIANDKLSTVEKQLEHSDKLDFKENAAYKRILHELSNEKSLRRESEARLNEIKRELDRELQLKQIEVEREKLIGATLTELSEEKQARIEQEKLLNVTKHRFIGLGKQLEQVESELEKTKKQLAKERLTKRNQEKLLSEANRKLSGLCDLLDEKQNAQTLNGDDRDQMRVYGDEILYISTNKQPPSSDFPDVSNSNLPLANLHAGSQRPKRKKNHSPLSPIIGAFDKEHPSLSNSDSDDLIQF